MESGKFDALFPRQVRSPRKENTRPETRRASRALRTSLAPRAGPSPSLSRFRRRRVATTPRPLAQLKQDHTFSQPGNRDMFLRKMPAYDITAHSAFGQNDLSSALTTDWSHALRGMKY